MYPAVSYSGFPGYPPAESGRGRSQSTTTSPLLQTMSTLLLLAMFMPFLTSTLSTNGYTTITVATYNLWNVMFQWDVRKHRIADMIRKSSPDVIAFQEVRADEAGIRNQLNELQVLVPVYKHFTFHPVSKVLSHLGLPKPPGWELEGLGILSKHPFILSHVVNLTVGKRSPDKNQRVLLHAQLDVGGNEFDITVVHFSYDKMQQCQNAMDTVDYIASTGSERLVVLGDFNAYNDFSWPVSAVMKGSFDRHSKCRMERRFQPQDSSSGYGFVDAWVKAHRHATGFTFSNMPEPGLISRPDRILVSQAGLEVINTELLGDGKTYLQKYSFWNKWQRLKTVISMARETARGPNFSYSCHQDCGPHGSCRCGICVKGGNKNICDLPFCYECDTAHYNSFLLLMMLYSALALFVFYVLVKRLLKCCLSRGRRNPPRLIFLCPNKALFIFMAVLLCSIYLITVSSFNDSLKTVQDRIPEEMFPSDHLMVITKLKLTYR